MSRVRTLVCVVIGLLLGGPGAMAAQALGASTGGAVALRQAERMLGHTKRVLMVAAHPDDEDTELLTVLVRGQGAEAAYLSLSRGEGGQNLIGPELGEALGLIRTEELLSARRLDGARQYFTRAFDFGFSKNIEETSRFWPRDSVLKDAVRVIRKFQPQIVVAIFSGTLRDGHGQHQMAGWAALEAFKVAGDSARFPELFREEGLTPWTPVKLYRSARFDQAGATLSLDGGVLDHDIGQSYRQVAMRGRSLHRSQDMGVLQEPGPSTIRLALITDRTNAGNGGGMWAGIDTTAAAPGSDGIAARDQARHAANAAVIRAGLIVDATAADGRIVPGQRLPVRLTVWNGGTRPAAAEFALSAPPGWTVTPCTPARVTVDPGTVRHCAMEAVVPEDAPLTTPYFLRAPRDGAMYRWQDDPPSWGEPFEPPALIGRVTLTPEGGSPVLQEREVVYRYRDQAIGEVRTPLLVVPRVGVKLDPAEKVWPTGGRSPQLFRVTLQHGVAEPTRGMVTLELPAGWPAVPSQPFSLTRAEERETLLFQVRSPPGLTPGSYEVRAVARDSAGRRYSTGQRTVEYPHIRTRAWAQEAKSAVHAAPIRLPIMARVGYIRGASDRVPEALIDLGLPVELLDAATLERGDLSRYDVIVVGSRAYEVDAALVENNARLLEYVRTGGRLLVQYQQQQFFNGRFAPAPLSVGQPHDRVTDETAPVTLLEPTSPVFVRPNRIGPADWNGWVQERGLYFARTWDPAYRPLLGLSDPGGPELRGGLLVASVGRGTYTYTGLSFFRQLPAGIPGAYRLFLNLLALRVTPPQP